MMIDASKIEDVLRKLKRRDPALFAAVQKKILQIAEMGVVSVLHFKNLRGSMSHLKMVHVGSFVLTFQIKGDTVVFEDFTHHDEAYKS